MKKINYLLVATILILLAVDLSQLYLNHRLTALDQKLVGLNRALLASCPGTAISAEQMSLGASSP